MNQAIIYSKKDGTNRLLPIDTNEDLMGVTQSVKEWFPDHMDFAYVLIDGVEIKLF